MENNFGLGTQEHTDLDIEYNMSIGIDTLDFYVVLLGTSGFKMADRLPWGHRISKEKAMHWSQRKYDGIILPSK